MNINESKRTTLSSVMLTAVFSYFLVVCATYKIFTPSLSPLFLNDEHDRKAAQAHQLVKPTCTHDNGITNSGLLECIEGATFPDPGIKTSLYEGLMQMEVVVKLNE